MVTPLVDMVRAEQGDGPIADQAVARVRRALLHGATLCAKELPSELGAGQHVLIHAVRALQQCGFDIVGVPRPRDPGQVYGRTKVDYHVTNPKHEPALIPVTKVRTSPPTPRKPISTATVIRRILDAGQVVTLERLAAEGHPLNGPDHLRRQVHNATHDTGRKVAKTHEGGYLLTSTAKSTSAKPARVEKTKHHVEKTNGHESSPMSALLSQFGGSLQLRGVFLDDDDDVHVALRNGVGTWDARIEGFHPTPVKTS